MMTVSFCVVHVFRMSLLGASQPAAPVWRHLWWMTRPQSRHWGRKVSQDLFPHTCHSSDAPSRKPPHWQWSIRFNLTASAACCVLALFKIFFPPFASLFFCVWTTAPPMFLPISSTPQPERRKTPQRRHSIEKETPTNVRQFLPPSKQSSKSLVSHTSFVFDINQFIEASTVFKRLKPGRVLTTATHSGHSDFVHVT